MSKVLNFTDIKFVDPNINDMPKKENDTYLKGVKALINYKARTNKTLEDLAKDTGLSKDTIGNFLKGINVGGIFLSVLMSKIPFVGSDMVLDIKTYGNFNLYGNINYDGSVAPLNFNDPTTIDLPSYYKKYDQIHVYKYQSAVINKFYSNFILLFSEYKNTNGVISEKNYNGINLIVTKNEVGSFKRYYGFLSVAVDIKNKSEKFIVLNTHDGTKIKYDGEITHAYPLVDIKSQDSLKIYSGVKL
jgi:transcriptional regulator with XRE-family HTH domain